MQGTQVLASLHSIHFNPKHWKQPNEFNPGRFLNEDGSKIINTEHLVPFSVGKRECLGKTLAEKEFFLFFANLMHKFSFHQVEGQMLPSADSEHDWSKGLTRSVPYHTMKIKKRT